MGALNIYSVGLDVSSRSSMVAIAQTSFPSLQVKIGKPFSIAHTNEGLKELVDRLRALGGEIKILMEHTGRYYESVAITLHNAGLFVSAINPLLIKEDGNGELRGVKTDKADAKKIAEFGVKYWAKLREYTPDDTIRYNLKTLNRQFQFYSETRTAHTNNLIALLEQTYPGVKALFKSPVREDGHQKWLDFVETFWHVDCVRELSLEEFIEQYRIFCKERRYQFSTKKAAEIYSHAQQLIPLTPMSETSKLLVQEAVNQVNTISRTVETLRAEMNRTASQLPEYDTVMNMAGVGPSLGPQLIAEIGDIRRFKNKHSLPSYAGIDPGKKQSGALNVRSNKTSQRGSPHLRKAAFLVMGSLMRCKLVDDPVYQFLDKKRAEGKHYYVYITAGANKFLRMYYGKVRDCLKEKGLWDVDEPETSSEVTE